MSDEERLLSSANYEVPLKEHATAMSTSPRQSPRKPELSKTSGQVRALYQSVSSLERLRTSQRGHNGPAIRINTFDGGKDIWDDWRNKFVMTSMINDWSETMAKGMLVTRLPGPIVHAHAELFRRSETTLMEALDSMDAWFRTPEDPPATSQRPLDLQVQSQVASLDDSEHDATMTYDHTPDDNGDLNSTQEYEDEEQGSGRSSESPVLQGPVPQCGSPLAPGN